MKCPKCNEYKDEVMSTTLLTGGGNQRVKRMRHCRECGAKWQTFEFTAASLGPYIGENGRLLSPLSFIQESVAKLASLAGLKPEEESDQGLDEHPLPRAVGRDD